MPPGIDFVRLVGDDPNFGNLFGAAVNAQVTSNRFCHVTTPITIQPGANATKSGTLICPYPFPTLAIVPAVLLSWPGEEDGYAVESAPSVNGPWTPSDATPFTQSGRHSLSVPTEGTLRSFRLVKH